MNLSKTRKTFYNYILGLVTIIFMVVMSSLFNNSMIRVFDSIVDLFWSFIYYFNELFRLGFDIEATVNDLPLIVPDIDVPKTQEQFAQVNQNYWSIFFSKAGILGYLSIVVKVFYILAMLFASLLLPLIIVVLLLFKRYFSKVNNDYNKDSKCLLFFKNTYNRIIRPIKREISFFFRYVISDTYWLYIWLFIWLINFNIITILVEFLAFYLYFAMSFDIASVFTQLYKFCIDASVPINFIPVWLWIIVGLIVYFVCCRNIGYMRLNHMERKNRGFINERPIVAMVCGTMGKKKTTILTDMALSQEVMFRNKAFEKLLETDLKFPNFPWINLENYIKYCMDKHFIYNLASCKRLIGYIKYVFYNISSMDKAIAKSHLRHLKKAYKFDYSNICFDYDLSKYPFTYYNGLSEIDVWSAIETYAQLYFIYIIQSSLLVSNYSVRVDNVLADQGNFPLWNSEFFKKDSRLAQAYSRHAHILDFDSLRLGKKVVEHNPKSDSFEFGVVLVTEIGKERGNSLENQNLKKNDAGANQKNDLFNSWIKMCRHSSTVDNFPFIKFLTDEQRPESWGADARDLCEIVFIKENTDTYLTMPGLSLFDILYSMLFSKFENLYYQYRYNRSDNTLFMYLFKSIFSKIHHLHKRLYNTFGYSVAKVQIESGTQDGERSMKKYHLMSKKIYSSRFATDCFSDFFNNKSLKCNFGINDLEEYGCVKASLSELAKQHSYFIRDMEQKQEGSN